MSLAIQIEAKACDDKFYEIVGPFQNVGDVLEWFKKNDFAFPEESFIFEPFLKTNDGKAMYIYKKLSHSGAVYLLSARVYVMSNPEETKISSSSNT